MASREAEEEVGSPDAAPLVVARRWIGARSQHARFEQPYNLFDVVRRERDQGLRRVRHLRGHIVLLWDGGGVHRGSALDRLFERHARLHIERFPAYAPELNPDDRNGTTVTNLGRSHARGDGRGHLGLGDCAKALSLAQEAIAICRGRGTRLWEFCTCAIATCPPNELMAKIHDRMPVILPERCAR
jgi:DDE superfamily endonuclease